MPSHCRQPNPERCAAQARKPHRQGAALPFNGPAADRQAQAEAAGIAVAAAVQAVERLEDPLALLHRDADAVVLDGQQARITQASLETLAVIAYRQPVSRSRVAAVRGVNVDGVVRTLLARGLLVEAGQDTGSQATTYRTTPLLLEKLGLQSLDELPSLAPLLPDSDDVEDETTRT